ncbi:MAG: DNA gyrase subunit A, partial [Acutalibacteraceae bacterium]|nr:DNA gyrase subunit A [Acutalibacteraceae bacterium]
IDISAIPPTTTTEQIIERVIDLVKQKKITEINDIRDETDLKGLKITIDLKRGIDPDKLMKKLFKVTPLEDSFGCNFNILIADCPKVMGVKEIIQEWVAFRTECVKNRVFYNLTKAKEKLHLLKGLSKILLDIDKAIKIVRETEEEKEVVPNLMIGFGIDELQAEYVAEIKLRHLNRQYILKRLEDVENLEKEVRDMEELFNSKRRIQTVIIKELEAVAQKYGMDRKTAIVEADSVSDDTDEEVRDESPVTLFFTRDGYFKKIPTPNLRTSGEQKLKDGDEITQIEEKTNAYDLLFFSNKHQVYKAKTTDFGDGKASVLGDYIPSKLDFDEAENAIYMAATSGYNGFMVFVFDNGRVARVPMSSYVTKTNRKKLINAYCNKFNLHTVIYCEEECDLLLTSTNGRMLLISTTALSEKAAKDNGGIAVMTQKRGQRIYSAQKYVEGSLDKPHRYRPRNLPAAGQVKKDEDVEQMTF